MTLFTLGTSEGKEKAGKKAASYIPVTIIIMLLGFIYELLGHGVYSPYMVYAFAFPFILGFVFWYFMSRINKEIVISGFFINTWTAMLFTFMMGFIYKGVLDIYGTSAKLTIVYWIVGGFFLLLSLIAVCVQPKE